VETREVVQELAPTGSVMTHAEEALPGKVLIFSRASETISKKPHRGIFMVYDAAEKRITHMVLSQLYVPWGEYNVMPFERGPDNKIYFYADDANGTAMFRFDVTTCKIEPVLRHPTITGSAVISNPGAAMTFTRDRVYFGARQLVSVPLDKVVIK
jgi:hypothetical protein